MLTNRYYAIGVVGLIVLLSAGWIGSARADTYAYDQYGRLTNVTYTDGSSITYEYDDAGNRTTVAQTAASP